MLGFLKQIFKPKLEKDVATLQPIVEQILHVQEGLQALDDDALRAKSDAFRQAIAEGLQAFTDERAQLEATIAQAKAEGRIHDQDAAFERLDALKQDENKALEQILEGLLPEAFAVVRETCRRLAENGGLTVTATQRDRDLAETTDYVSLQDDRAHWSNTWSVSGEPTTWKMVHYPVQLMGGIVLHRGDIAEMATGEGKTLVATLPMYLNALAGKGVHLVTVNDYLARRDAEWNRPLFEFHGMTVDCIDDHEPNSEGRRQAYRADLVYGTNNEFGFDYLRDNMTTHPEHLVQRPLHYAVVDEVDSVLIDDARTPLIISGPTQQGDKQQYDQWKPRVERLVNAQRTLINNLLTKARNGLKQNPKDAEASLALFRAYRGLPKYKALIKYLSEEGVRPILQKTEAIFLADNSRRMPEADEELFFTIDERNQQVELTDKGREFLAQSGEDANLYVLDDLGAKFAELEGRTDLPADQRAQEKSRLSTEYTEKAERVHTISQLLKAYTLFEKDDEYIVADGKVKIVDENTGRVMEGRRYSDGLHQAIEAKENVKIEAATQTYATVTLQNYFRMYHKLAGMTGTAETESAEFHQIYKLDVVVVPTNRPIARDDRDDLVYRTKREKYNAIIEEIEILSQQHNRPILVGTTSVETSEVISRMLKMRGIKHNVLNAKQHEREAQIVAEAGLPGRVTIATNMAGRGTDIKLGPGVKESGGLAIIGSERHESRRIDRQLRGRAGRQGDPGSSQFFVSLEDDLMRLFNPERIAKVMNFLKMQEGEVITHSMVTKSISNAQRKVEENNFSIRKRLLEYDDVMNQQREAIYKRRRAALFGDRIQVDLDAMLHEHCSQLAERYFNTDQHEELTVELIRTLAVEPPFGAEELPKLSQTELQQAIYQAAAEAYQAKKAAYAQNIAQFVQQLRANGAEAQVLEAIFTDGVRALRVAAGLDELEETQGRAMWTNLEKQAVLLLIDDRWQRHLRDMDDLKQSVQMASFEQKDPLLIYKFEAYQLYQTMLTELQQEVLALLFRAHVAQQQESAQQRQARRDDFSRLRARQGAAAEGRPQPQGPPASPEGGVKLSRAQRRAQDRSSKGKR